VVELYPVICTSHDQLCHFLLMKKCNEEKCVWQTKFLFYSSSAFLYLHFLYYYVTVCLKCVIFAFDIMLIYVVALKQFGIVLPNFKTDIEIIKKNMKNGTVIPEKRQ